MKIVNDKTEEKSPKTQESFFNVLVYSIYCGLGAATVILGPLPMIVSHLRMVEPWPKIAALIGSVLAITLLKTPAFVVLLVFIIGLFIADSVAKGVNLWALIRNTLLIGSVTGLALMFFLANQNGLYLPAYWKGFVDELFITLQTTGKLDAAPEMKFKGVIFYQGPFLYCSALIVSLWMSVGIVSHLGWFPKGHAFSAANLRKITFPKELSIAFVLLFAGATVPAKEIWWHLISGLFQVVQTLMFISGAIFLSRMLHNRSVRNNVRTLVYCVAASLGFYALVGMGVIRPFFPYKRISRKVLTLEEKYESNT